jgi:hypothetical protein
VTSYRVPARYLPPRRYRGPYRVHGGSRQQVPPIAIVAAGIFLLAGVGTAGATVVTQHQHHHAAPRPSAAGLSGTLDCYQLEQLWDAAGGNPSAAFMAAEVATAESAGQQYATLVDGNGTTDRGYFQINSIWGALSTYDPLSNAKAAVEISHDGTNFGPWTTYQTGAYQGRC